MAIMNYLLQNGWDWDKLMNAKQIWGWIGQGGYGSPAGNPWVQFTTDAGLIDVSLKQDAINTLNKAFGQKFKEHHEEYQSNETFAPNFERQYGDPNKPDELRTPPFKVRQVDSKASLCYNIASAWKEGEFSAIIAAPQQRQLWQEGEGVEQPNETNGIFKERMIDGWKVWEMESGEYDGHDALYIDNNKKLIVINYQGHHQPMFEGFTNANIPYHSFAGVDYGAGHWRSIPSSHEPFGQGFGWHNGEPSPESTEKNIIKQVLKEHYGVEKLQDAYKPYDFAPYQEEEEEPNWNTDDSEPDEDHYAKVAKVFPELLMAPPKKVNMAREVFKTLPPKSTFFIKENMQRFMVKTDGEVIMGNYETHADLIRDFVSPQAANIYDSGISVTSKEYPFITGGYLSDGDIHIVKSEGEPEFDITSVAQEVYEQAKREGIWVTGNVIYEDRTKAFDNLTNFFVREGV